jgi:hypothetical protein
MDVFVLRKQSLLLGVEREMTETIQANALLLSGPGEDTKDFRFFSYFSQDFQQPRAVPSSFPPECEQRIGVQVSILSLFSAPQRDIVKVCKILGRFRGPVARVCKIVPRGSLSLKFSGDQFRPAPRPPLKFHKLTHLRPCRLLFASVLLFAVLPSFGQNLATTTPSGPSPCQLFEPLEKLPASAETTPHDQTLDLSARLLAIYNHQARVIRTLKTVAEVRVIRGPKFGTSAGKSRMVGSFMDFEQPAWLRVTGVAPLAGTKLFDMASDGREFHLLAPDHDKLTLFVGPSESQPDFTAGRMNMRPQEFLDALRWEEGKLLLNPESQPIFSPQLSSIDIALPSRAGTTASGKLHFNLAAGTVSSLEILNAAGVTISKLEYSEWRNSTGSDQQVDTFCYPYHVRVIHPVEDYQVEIKFVEVKLNPRLDRSGFRFHTPHGVPVVRVSETAN